VEGWGSPGLAAQAAYFRHLGTVGEVLQSNGVYAVRTGVMSNTENGVISTGSVSSSVAAEAIAWLGGVPASWLCAEDEGREETARVLVGKGCRPDNDAWEMRGPVGDPVVAVPSGITVARVSSDRDLDAWLDVAGRCGWFETEADRRARFEVYRSLGHAPSAPLCLYVACRGDRPVGMASALYTDELVLLAELAVLDDEQRRGIGRVLALTRLAEARDRGCATAVLAPSPDGAKLYATLGFETHRQPSDRWFYLPLGEG
jgi:GNAT superfamily N-acetyltransferase